MAGALGGVQGGLNTGEPISSSSADHKDLVMRLITSLALAAITGFAAYQLIRMGYDGVDWAISSFEKFKGYAFVYMGAVYGLASVANLAWGVGNIVVRTLDEKLPAPYKKNECVLQTIGSILLPLVLIPSACFFAIRKTK